MMNLAPVEEQGLFTPVRIISWPKGTGLSAAFSFSASRDREKEAPSFTRLAACLRFAAVIRLIAPRSSSFPQRPQLDNSVIHSPTLSRLTPSPASPSIPHAPHTTL